MNDYQVVLIHGPGCSPDFSNQYQAIYHHWKEMWSATFQELDGEKSVFSDNFTRQQEVLGVFHQNRCVAVICYRVAQLGLDSTWEDSYFSTWPLETLRKFSNEQGSVVIGNQISIDPAYRKVPGEPLMKDILLWFFLRRLKSKQNVDLILGAIREDKSLDKLFVKYGAEILKKNVLQHHVPVALISFRKNQIRLENPDLPIFALNQIYENREEDPILNAHHQSQQYRRIA